jgi:PAS domain S-box-containing protein
MEKKLLGRAGGHYQTALAALAAGLCYWLLQSALDALVFYGGGLAANFLHPDPHELWSRFLVIVFLAGFGFYAHFGLHRLRESEERHRAILNNVVDAIITINEKAEVLSLNPAGERIFGYDKAEVIGKNVNMLMPEPYHSEHNAYIRNYLATGNAKIIGIGREAEARRKDGSLFPIYLAVSEVRLDGKRLFTGIIRDITEQKRAEEAMNRLASIVDSSSDAIIGKSLDGTIVSWNWGAERTYGYKADEVIGRNISILVPPDRTGELPAIFERIRNGERIENYETVRVRKDGSPIDVSVTISPIKDKAGTITGYSAIARDITEKKALERQKADLYAMVTHDLKAPLTVVMGYADLMKDSKKDIMDADSIEMIEAIGQNADKMMQLVEDFLTTSRLESGKLTINIEKEDLLELVSGTYEQCLPLARNKGVELVVESCGELKPMFLDRKYISRAINNLVGNAINYTPAGGRVVIKTGLIRADSDDMAVISVSDTGIGIPESERSKIFEKYYRSPGVVGVKGTGLGLAIAKAVAEAHGGRIELDSEPGKGSTFRLVLPVRY